MQRVCIAEFTRATTNLSMMKAQTARTLVHLQSCSHNWTAFAYCSFATTNYMTLSSVGMTPLVWLMGTFVFEQCG